MIHYPDLIPELGAPNGLCSSITESKHIKAVKQPWRRSNRYNALGQMLVTNERTDKLAASQVDFQDRNLLSDSIFASAGWEIEPLVNDVEMKQGVDDDFFFFFLKSNLFSFVRVHM